MFSGAQISLYPMSDDFIGIILKAIKALDPYRPHFRIETDDVSTLIECWPFRLPCRASNRLPGGDLKSSSLTAAFTIRSLRRAIFTRSDGYPLPGVSPSKSFLAITSLKLLIMS